MILSPNISPPRPSKWTAVTILALVLAMSHATCDLRTEVNRGASSLLAPELDIQGTGRRPLVVVSGVTEQLPAADYISSVGGMSTNGSAPATGDVQTTTETVSTTLTAAGAFSLSGTIAPAAFTGTRIDNYNPTSLATTYVIDQAVTTATTITGLTAQPTGTQIDFRNLSTSAASLTFTNQDASSLSANQFRLSGGVSWTLPPGCSILFRYTGSDWRMIALVSTEYPSVKVDTSFTNAGQTLVTGAIAPTSISSTQNNYNPTGLATASEIDQVASTNVTITGLTAQPTGTQIRFCDTSASATITLANASGSSLAANQFNFGASWVLQAGECVLLRYGGSNWTIISVGANATLDVPNFIAHTQATVGAMYYGVTTTTTTGVQNDFVLNNAVSVVQYNGAGTASITGFLGGAAGRFLAVENWSNSDLTLPNLTGSSAGHQLKHPGNADIVLKGGTESSALYLFDSTNAVWRLVAVVSATNAIPTQFTSALNRGTVTLSAGAGTVTVTSGSICTCSDTTATAAVKCSVASTTLTVAGTGTDVIAYLCF